MIEQFKAIPSNASPKRLVRKYLEFCWSLPYYGSAFFHGQIETPARSLTSLIVNHDTEVLIAINASGFYVIDPVNVVILLGLKLEVRRLRRNNKTELGACCWKIVESSEELYWLSDTGIIVGLRQAISGE